MNRLPLHELTTLFSNIFKHISITNHQKSTQKAELYATVATFFGFCGSWIGVLLLKHHYYSLEKDMDDFIEHRKIIQVQKQENETMHKKALKNVLVEKSKESIQNNSSFSLQEIITMAIVVATCCVLAYLKGRTLGHSQIIRTQQTCIHNNHFKDPKKSQ